MKKAVVNAVRHTTVVGAVTADDPPAAGAGVVALLADNFSGAAENEFYRFVFNNLIFFS